MLLFNTTRRTSSEPPPITEPLSLWTEVWPTQPVQTQAVNRQSVGEEKGSAVPSVYWWLMTLYRKFGIINLLREVVGGRPLPLGCGGPRARPRFRQVSSISDEN